jgi:hypothetical protein
MTNSYINGVLMIDIAKMQLQSPLEMGWRDINVSGVNAIKNPKMEFIDRHPRHATMFIRHMMFKKEDKK